MSDFPNLTVLNHPLVLHKVSLMRAQETGKALFKELMEELAILLAYEATRDLPTEGIEIRTPRRRRASLAPGAVITMPHHQSTTVENSISPTNHGLHQP